MSESIKHQELVNSIANWINGNIEKSCNNILMIDSPDSCASCKPPQIGEHIPDVYMKKRDNGVVIGEAKTLKDIENKHTKSQLMSYLLYANEYEFSYLVVAVPWQMSRFVKSMLLNLCKNYNINNVSCVIIDGVND